jgi:hypothetical protein
MVYYASGYASSSADKQRKKKKKTFRGREKQIFCRLITHLTTNNISQDEQMPPAIKHMISLAVHVFPDVM